MNTLNGLKYRTLTFLALSLCIVQISHSAWAQCPLPDPSTTIGIPSPVTFTTTLNNGYPGFPDGGSYMKVTISPSGSYAGGDYKAWCSDAAASINLNTLYPAIVIDSQFTSCPNAVHGSCVPVIIYQPDSSFTPDSCVWNEINYLINHKQGNADSVQAAIWALISPPDATALATTPNWNATDVVAMVAAALANSSFVPGPGQLRAAILYSEDDVQLVFIEIQIPCPPCAPHDIKYNFNGTQIIFQSTPGGSYVWFIGDGVVSGLPSNHKVVLHISDQSITIPAVGSSPQYVVPVPDSYITFDPSATLATTTFDSVNHLWLMTFPRSGMSGNIFYGGAAFKVPVAGLPGGIKNVDWQGTFTSDTAGLTVKWQWHAANYKNFTSDYNSIAPKPTDDTSASIYKNSDHAGTPEGTDSVSGQPWKKFVVGGGSGGGGANYTGSGSSTISFTPCGVCPTP
jgi:hypothetical protein